MTTPAATPTTPSAALPGLGRFRFALAAGFVFSAVINLLMLSLPLYSLQVFARAIPAANLNTLALLTVAVVLALSVTALLEAIRARLFNRAGTALDVRFRPRLMAETLESGPRARAAGASLADLGELRGFLNRPQFGALLDLPWLPFYLLGIGLIHPLLAAVMLAGAVLLLAAGALTDLFTRSAQARAREDGARAHRLAEATTGRLDTVRALRVQAPLLDRWQEAALAAQAAGGTAHDRTTTGGAVTRWLRYLLQVAVTAVAAGLVMDNHLSFGAMIATTMLITRALAPVDALAGGLSGTIKSLAAWRRVMPVLKDLSTPAAESAPVAAEGRVNVENLLVLAGRDQKPLLRGVNLELAPGEVLCIFGPNRSGKTMLAKALTGALKPYAGTVRLDGIDAVAWRPSGGLGYVPQQPEMLPGTIAENIARFTAADRAEIEALAKELGLHEAVLALPQGYDTDAVEAAAAGMLSAGTERLIALARAAFGQPRVLVVDEVAAHLDVPGQERVRRFLAGLRAGGTTLVLLSHQSTFLELADKVMVLKDGTVAAYGPRDQVVRSASPRRPTVAAAQNA